MPKIITLALFVFFVCNSFASENSIILPKKKASEILIAVGKSGQKVSLTDLTHMKAKDYEAMTGKKLNLVDKIGLKLSQRELKKTINPDGTLNQKKMEMLNRKMARMSEQGHHYLHLFILFLALAVGLAIIGIFVPFVWILSALAWLGAVIFFILWLVNMA